jgi:hypothetical protein
MITPTPTPTPTRKQIVERASKRIHLDERGKATNSNAVGDWIVANFQRSTIESWRMVDEAVTLARRAAGWAKKDKAGMSRRSARPRKA